MKEFLLQHAVRNVWCSPFQDDQAILKLARVSSIDRCRDYFKWGWQNIKLPMPGIDFHVYGIGQNSQKRLNLIHRENVWVNLNEITNTRYMQADTYTLNGLMWCRSKFWVMRLRNQCYIVAAEIQPSIANLDKEDLYLRLYQNAYFESDRDTSGTAKVMTGGGEILNVQEALEHQTAFLNYRQYPFGFAYAFHNGYYVDNFLPDEVAKHDFVDYTYDASIDEVYDFRVEDLRTFTSTLDKTTKYLIHPPKSLDTIAYRDDVDFFVIHKRANGRLKGVYLNRNLEKTVRMITHRDWGVPTNLVNSHINSMGDWGAHDEFYIRVHVKKAGYHRPLIDEHNRIKELYKLEDDQIVRAMVGLDSTLDEWKAANLESSNYTRIMRSFYEDIKVEQVVDAYGYNSMAKITGDSPVPVENGDADVPVGMQNSSTAFEYDSNGYLVAWRRHVGGPYYYPFDSRAASVEFISGIGSNDADFTTSNEITVLRDNESYRFYVTSIGGNLRPLNNWIDVTNDPKYYRVGKDGRVEWMLDITSQLGVVRGNSHFVCYDVVVPGEGYLYRLSMNYSKQGNVMMIPPGRIDLWMNGRALVENIDYYVKYPEIIVVNKEYLVEGAQRFTVRGFHFPDKKLERYITDQRGFTAYGKVSVNSHYDVRDDKVIQCIVDGRTFHRSALEFAEDFYHLKVPGIENGRPYVIQDAIVAVRDVFPRDTYPLRHRSIEMDKKVEDYLTERMPEKLPPSLSPIKDFYQVYSPFMGKIIYDLINRAIVPICPNGEEKQVAKLLKDYMYLLDYDPCRRDDVNAHYVKIHPHPSPNVLTVTQTMYAFCERVNRLYLNSKLDFTQFLNIEGMGECNMEAPDIPVIPPPVIPDPIEKVVISTSTGDMAPMKVTKAALTTAVREVVVNKEDDFEMPVMSLTKASVTQVGQRKMVLGTSEGPLPGVTMSKAHTASEYELLADITLPYAKVEEDKTDMPTVTITNAALTSKG